MFWGAGVWAPYFPLYLASLGFDGPQIGFLMALQPTLRWSSAIVWAYAADRWRVRHRLLVVAAAVGACWFVPQLFARRFGAMVTVTSLIAVFHAPLIPMLDATVMDHLPRLGQDYGRLRMWGSLGFVLGAVLSAPLIQRFSPRVVPLVLLVAAVSMVPALVRLPREQMGARTHDATPWSLLSAPFAAFLATGFLVQLSCGAWTGFFAVHTATLGFSAAVPGLTWGLAVTAEIALLFRGRKILAWLSPVRLILLAIGVTVMRWGLTAIARDEIFVIGLQLAHAFTFSALHLAALVLIARLVPIERSTSGQALYGLVVFGCGGSAGVYLAGRMVDHVGTANVFGIEAVVATLAFIPTIGLWRLMRHVASPAL